MLPGVYNGVGTKNSTKQGMLSIQSTDNEDMVYLKSDDCTASYVC